MASVLETPVEIDPQGKFKQALVELLPDQGCWTEEAYLVLTDTTKRLVEFTDGNLEVLPMPTERHQCLMEFLYAAFSAYIQPRGGKAHTSGTRLRIRRNKFREPDVILLRDAKDPRRESRVWTGADLAVEVVSEDHSDRDLVDKRHDYAEGGVPEYWIANPKTEKITVLRLEGDAYVEHGVFDRGTKATSALLEGFSVEVSAVFDAE